MALLKYSLIVFLFVLGSCATQKRCAKKYPPQIITKDSVIENTTIEYKDKIIYDTIRETKIIDISKDTAFAENEFAYAKAWNQNKRTKLLLVQKPQIRKIPVKNAIMIVQNDKQYYQTRTKIIEKPYVKWYHKASMWIAIPVVLLILAYLVYKAVRLYLKIQSGGVI